MKQLHFTATMFDETADQVKDVFGMDEEQMADNFATLCTAIQTAVDEDKVKTLAEAVSLMATFDFFPQFIVTSGLIHFLGSRAHVLEIIAQKHAEKLQAETEEKTDEQPSNG
jgi:hypothetical protein